MVARDPSKVDTTGSIPATRTMKNKIDYSAANRRIRREITRLGYVCLAAMPLDVSSPKLLYLLENQSARVIARTPVGRLRAK